MSALALIAAVSVGYVAGRIRPLCRLNDRAWWLGVANVPGGHDIKWGVLWLILNPAKTARLLVRQ